MFAWVFCCFNEMMKQQCIKEVKSTIKCSKFIWRHNIFWLDNNDPFATPVKAGYPRISSHFVDGETIVFYGSYCTVRSKISLVC